MASGKINVSVENIFPLIKKFLYNDHEIFLRELVSNATPTLKLKHLTSIGEA
jgi:molecular chaperone HtpG